MRTPASAPETFTPDNASGASGEVADSDHEKLERLNKARDAFEKFQRGAAEDDAAKMERLVAEVEMLRDRLAASRTAPAVKKSTWKPQSLRALPGDTPLMNKPGNVLAVRRMVFDWLGSYSFVLRLSSEERKMMTKAELELHRSNRDEFVAAWTPASVTQLQHDIYLELKRHLGGSILVAPIFNTVTTELAECATYLWDAFISAFHPRSFPVVASVIAESAVAILRGPDHDTADADKAFRKWDAAVGDLNQNARDLPPLTAEMLSTCLMYASLHASKADPYYQAYSQLQASLAQSSVTFDAATVRAAAVSAFQAEQRRRSSASRALDSVEAFAFSAGPRRPITGTSAPAPSCCRCPHHCVLPDGTYRVVRAVETHNAVVPVESARDYCSGASAKTVRALKAYQAAVEDLHCPRDEVTRLGKEFEAERRSDRERDMYYRIQDEEAAVLARTGYGSDDDDF